MNTYPCILQCSLQSKRLPKKALLGVEGKPLVERVIEGILPSPAIKSITIQLPNEKAETPLLSFLDSLRTRWQRESGKPVDIIQYGEKATWWDFSFIKGKIETPFFRVTGDCPLLDTDHFAAMVKEWRYNRASLFTHHDTWDEGSFYPDGWDIELINIDYLAYATWDLRVLYTKYEDRLFLHPSFIPRPPALTASVNTWQDLEMIRRIFREVEYPHSYIQVAAWWNERMKKEKDLI